MLTRTYYQFHFDIMRQLGFRSCLKIHGRGGGGAKGRGAHELEFCKDVVTNGQRGGGLGDRFLKGEGEGWCIKKWWKLQH